ncbi:MAG: ADP-ribosylglycohydrolase family protein [Bacteroidales bacterium]|nr:ADP-ribosylglycohydrolase family protein [Bacteroidales bacterium]
MLGAIIGDIVGSRFEYGGRNVSNFKLFTPECAFTDDTICTVAIADAIINGAEYSDNLVKWCTKYPFPLGGYGSKLTQWLKSEHQKPYDSWGNGSAMRVSAIGWAFDSEAKTVKEAIKSAKPTHSHPEGIKGAICVANLIYVLRNKQLLKEDVADYVKEHFEYNMPILSEVKGMHDSCMEAVPDAIECFLEAHDFESTIRNAVELGGDTDTTAAIAGSIAEAKYPIPQEMKEQALKYLDNDMKAIIAEFFAKFR